jgi:UDP-MurNAc hydroxylase
MAMGDRHPNECATSTLHFFGHNCFLVRAGKDLLLIDPWLSSQGAFFGSWFQYPKNHMFQSTIVDMSKQQQLFVYVTHEHQDHFDLDTIRLLDKSTKFLVPRYKDGYLSSTIRNLGFCVTELEDLTCWDIGAHVRIKVFISDVGVNHDSALLIETDDFRFFNQNDCKIFDRLDLVQLPIDYYSVQFSGATWHPVCYTNYTDIQKQSLSEEKISTKFRNVIYALAKLSPSYFIPSAGPAIFPFLETSLSSGQDNIFVHQPTLHRFLRDNNINCMLYPRPGEEINPSTSTTPFGAPTAEDLSRYRNGIGNPWERVEVDFEKDQLIAAVEARLERISDIKSSAIPLLVFKWGEGHNERIGIDLNSKTVLDQIDVAPQAFYQLTACKKYFGLMSSPGIRWQDIHLSLRASVHRNPDNFNNIINIFMFSDVSNIRSSFLASLGTPCERIIVSGKKGDRFEIDRYCPHQGADLSCARITELNELICPRHGWIFSLETGGKSRHSNDSLQSKKLEASA